MEFIRADWQAPARVQALTTTRLNGCSQAPYDSLNLGDHVADQPESVALNRERLLQNLALVRRPQWLQQVHGTDVVRASDSGSVLEADACWTDESGLACIVMTADCLPVFFTDRAASRVAVAHAGWRGLAAGILENTLQVFADPEEVLVWLGPAIGPEAFEVGEEVRQAFVSDNPVTAEAFQPTSHSGKYMADLYQLARVRLASAGVTAISGGEYCTFQDSHRFYSYRRDGQTGRMASIIWLESE